MENQLETPLIRPIEHEPTRFEVASRTPGVEPWLVDVEGYDGNGECGCPHFERRLSVLLTDPGSRRPGQEPPFQCFHIKLAKAYYELLKKEGLR